MFGKRRTERIKRGFKSGIMALVVYAILICIVFLILYPLLVRLADMFKSFDDLVDKSVVFIPKKPTLERVKMAADGMKYWTSFTNTMLVCSMSALLQTIACSMIGYGFARTKVPFKRLLFGLVILTMLMPAPMLMPSFYVRFRFFDVLGIVKAIHGAPLNLLDSYGPFIILSITGLGFRNGLYIYLVRQFFRNMPKELEESGRIDGAGFIRIFFQIMLPNALPIMITVSLFSFSWQWTDQYFSSLFFKSNWVLSNALSLLTGYGHLRLDPVIINAVVSSGIILVVLPVLILYLFLQRFFIRGIERSGLTG